MTKKDPSVIQQRVREAMLRRNPSDIIMLGDIVEESYVNTGFSEILHALTQGRIMQEATDNKNGTPSDRILGRIEMAGRITQDLEQFIIDRNNAKKPVRRVRRSKPSPLAEEPEVPEDPVNKYGGQI